MALWVWDASALVKRYAVEMGSNVVAALFAAVPLMQMATTPWGYAETYSILLRKLNSGILDTATFTAATSALQNEIVANADFTLLSVDDATIFASIWIIRQHNLNATDAALLTLLRDYLAAYPDQQATTVLVAADRRLLRAADSEGIRTINPELVDPAAVPAFVATVSGF